MGGRLLTWKLPYRGCSVRDPSPRPSQSLAIACTPAGLSRPPWTPQDEEINLSARGRHSPSFQSPSLLLELMLAKFPRRRHCSRNIREGRRGTGCMMLVSQAKQCDFPELASVLLLVPAKEPWFRASEEGPKPGRWLIIQSNWSFGVSG